MPCSCNRNRGTWLQPADNSRSQRTLLSRCIYRPYRRRKLHEKKKKHELATSGSHELTCTVWDQHTTSSVSCVRDIDSQHGQEADFHMPLNAFHVMITTFHVESACHATQLHDLHLLGVSSMRVCFNGVFSCQQCADNQLLIPEANSSKGTSMGPSLSTDLETRHLVRYVLVRST